MLYVTNLTRVVVGTGLQLPSPIWARPTSYSVAPADCCVCGSSCWLWCALFICFFFFFFFFFCHGLCQCQLPLFPFAHHLTTSQTLLGPTTACLNTVKSALHVRFFAVGCGGVSLWRIPVCCVVFLMGSLCVFHCLVTSGRCLCRLFPLCSDIFVAGFFWPLWSWLRTVFKGTPF